MKKHPCTTGIRHLDHFFCAKLLMAHGFSQVIVLDFRLSETSSGFNGLQF